MATATYEIDRRIAQIEIHGEFLVGEKENKSKCKNFSEHTALENRKHEKNN